MWWSVYICAREEWEGSEETFFPKMVILSASVCSNNCFFFFCPSGGHLIFFFVFCFALCNAENARNSKLPFFFFFSPFEIGFVSNMEEQFYFFWEMTLACIYYRLIIWMKMKNIFSAKLLIGNLEGDLGKSTKKGSDKQLLILLILILWGSHLYLEATIR